MMSTVCCYLTNRNTPIRVTQKSWRVLLNQIPSGGRRPPFDRVFYLIKEKLERRRIQKETNGNLLRTRGTVARRQERRAEDVINSRGPLWRWSNRSTGARRCISTSRTSCRWSSATISKCHPLILTRTIHRRVRILRSVQVQNVL